MTLRSRFIGAAAALGMGFSAGTAISNDNNIHTIPPSANYMTAQNDATSSPDYIVAQAAPETAVTVRTETAAQIGLIQEIGTRVYGSGYVVLEEPHINTLLWDALPKEDLIKAGFNPEIKPQSSFDFYRAYDAIFVKILEPENSDYTEYTAQLMQKFLGSIDAHSSYMTPEDFKKFRTDTSGSFGGLGIEIKKDEDTGYINIEGLLDMEGGAPAEQAGVLEGDAITHIDGADVTEMEIDDTVDLMRGTVGTSINITVKREGLADPIDFTVIRNTIVVKPAKSDLYDGGNIGYVKLNRFGELAYQSMADLFNEMQNSENPPSSYILDLRNNPGGLLNQSEAISDAFLDSGTIVTTSSRGIVISERLAQLGDLIGGKPLDVLINSGSASASEIVSGALQEYDRATIVGTKSFGKGSVQTIMPLPNGGALRLTTALYYVGDNKSIQGNGVTPDITVTFGMAALNNQERLNEADNEKSIIDQLSAGKAISSDNYVCMQTPQLQSDLATLDERFKAKVRKTKEDISDSALLCAIEHLKGESKYTLRALQTDATAAPAVSIGTPQPSFAPKR